MVGKVKQMPYSKHSHSAVFVEVKVDEDLGMIEVSRVVSAIAAGKILNLKTARSQILGGIVWGVGQALHEVSKVDHHFGRIMNHSFAEYHIPVQKDLGELEVHFVKEVDDVTSMLGVKGLGEIGIVGTAAAVANAVFHATGKRIRELPITPSKLI
jgi:xanthine dehydrogenase YagR molybdenum-binding subunit